MATRTEVSSPRGVKRCGDDSLDSEQRLAKRFNLLNIGKPAHPQTALQILTLLQRMRANSTSPFPPNTLRPHQTPLSLTVI